MLFKEDKSVVIIDFEKGVLSYIPDEQMTTEDEIVEALLEELQQERCGALRIAV